MKHFDINKQFSEKLLSFKFLLMLEL